MRNLWFKRKAKSGGTPDAKKIRRKDVSPLQFSVRTETSIKTKVGINLLHAWLIRYTGWAWLIQTWLIRIST